ncbi:MAG TPA: STAS domain-containing protein [Tepidisphaeraceae bacterium]|nr:STAS domain-containing protein [Tepidisphaeraceae bacterium]
MAIKYEEYNQVCVIAPAGDLVAENSAQARQAVEQHIDAKQIVNFVIDFEKAGFVDSEGLETLLWIKRKAEELFGQVKLVNLDENVRKILEITRLEHRFECQPDLAAALKTMR